MIVIIFLKIKIRPERKIISYVGLDIFDPVINILNGIVISCNFIL